MEKTSNQVLFKIENKNKLKYSRSFDFVREILKSGGYKVDLRKASKTNIPLAITAGCCGTSLKIRRKKDFPLKDTWCKCRKTKMIEWR